MLDHRLEKSTKVLEKVCKSFYVNVCDSDKKTWQSIDEPLVKIVKNIEVGPTSFTKSHNICISLRRD